MRLNQLTLIERNSEVDYSPSTLSETLTESLWDTVKNHALHIILREPALIELARRKDPGVIIFCDELLRSDDQERWFTGLKALESLNSYDAVHRLLVLCANSGSGDRRIILNVLARILSSAHREGFRRLLRSVVAPGELDVTGWTSTALRVLDSVCYEQGITIIDSTGHHDDIISDVTLQFEPYSKRKKEL